MGNGKYIAAAIAVAVITAGTPAAAEGNTERGAKAFRHCAACHSADKGAHRTGPSLAGIWGRKAGTIDGFRRYSKALKGAGLVWDETTLDKWLADPKALVPGNRMVFRGINDASERRDLIAYLKTLSGGGAKAAGAMEGRMMGQDPPDLRALDSSNQVARVTHCGDTFDVTTKDGKTHQFWELNLRLKVDSSQSGPPEGTPALIPAGMRGDRANLVFTSAAEIGAFIKQKC